MDERLARITRVIVGVLVQALEDARATELVLLDDGSPEAALIATMLGSSGKHGAAAGAGPDVAAVRLVRERATSFEPGDLLAAWSRAAAARPAALVAQPVNKTAALLGGALPGVVLPLGDLWASQVAALAGQWSAPAPVRSLAEAAGGIDSLDQALQALVDRRIHPDAACAGLPAGVRGTLLALWDDTRFARRFTGLVPKLGTRTLGVDLFD